MKVRVRLDEEEAVRGLFKMTRLKWKGAEVSAERSTARGDAGE